MKRFHLLTFLFSVAILSACKNDPDFSNFPLVGSSWSQKNETNDGTIVNYQLDFEGTTFKEYTAELDSQTGQLLGYHSYNEGTYEMIDDELHLSYQRVKHIAGSTYGDFSELKEIDLSLLTWQESRFRLEFAIDHTLLLLWTIDCPPNANCVDKQEFRRN